MHSVSISQQWRIQGEPGGPGHPLFSDQTEARSYFDGTNPITGKGFQLRSPTPIMAPVNSALGFDSKHLCDNFSAFNKYNFCFF